MSNDHACDVSPKPNLPSIQASFMVKLIMRKKSLKETNPFLKNPELRKALIEQTVSSSTAVEGVLTKYLKLSKSAKKKLMTVVRESEVSYE
jgi:hypothetical protein